MAREMIILRRGPVLNSLSIGLWLTNGLGPDQDRPEAIHNYVDKHPCNLCSNSSDVVGL